jgi:hypothetical protein
MPALRVKAYASIDTFASIESFDKKVVLTSANK